MSSKRYAIHPIISSCLIDDKIFIGPKELESIWRAINFENAETVYRKMTGHNEYTQQLKALFEREILYQYKVLRLNSHSFYKKKLEVNHSFRKNKRATYMKAAKQPSKNLYAINDESGEVEHVIDNIVFQSKSSNWDTRISSKLPNDNSINAINNSIDKVMLFDHNFQEEYPETSDLFDIDIDKKQAFKASNMSSHSKSNSVIRSKAEIKSKKSKSNHYK
jgi:hypothetical protein